MKIGRKALIYLALMASTLAAQTPTFSGVVNPASDLPPGVPNYGIAQGSVFIVYGTNLTGGNSLVQAALPLPNSLNATAITISQNNSGTILPVPILYASPGQLAAVMPSNAPLGSVTMTVNNNGKVGSTQVLVVASAFGISTADGSGNGVGAVTFGDYSYVTTSKSAKPGDTLILWGTGLGALPSGADDAHGAPFGNIPAAIHLSVGGVDAQVTYAGRAPGAVGLDQINFVVPQNAPLGCTVSIIVQTTAPVLTTSNGPTTAIATSNGVCTDPVQNLPQSLIPTFTSQNATKVLVVQGQQSTNYSFPPGGGAPVPGTQASAGVFFLSFSPSQVTSQISKFNNTSSINSCRTGVIKGATSETPPIATGLDAGSAITLTPASGGALSLPSVGTGFYSASANSLKGGTYTLSTTGASGVGPLSVVFPIPQPVTWTNATQLMTGGQIDRSQPLVINWTGVDPNAYVQIVGQAQLGPLNSPTYTIYFDCAAPANTGTFSVPPAVLSNMPPGTTAFASINVSTNTIPLSIGSVSGFDLALDLTQYKTSIPVVFK